MLRKIILFSATLFLTSTTLFSATPVQTHGALTVSGNQIVGAKDNQKVQVAGMSLYWTIWGGEKFYNRQAIDWMVQDWNITLIRAAMGVEPNSEWGKGYLAAPETQKNLVKTVVDAAIAKGIYVIVDWHAHDANHNVEEAKSFFSEMAQTYGSSPNVIWEIWNEPDNNGGSGADGFDTWDDIKNYANQVIPVIRKYSSNLIVVGTPNWAQHVDVAASSPISGSNIAYTLHFYAGTHGTWLKSKAETALSKGAALFITEFGLSSADGGNEDKNVYTNETQTWLDWADQKGISWANWSVVDKGESSAALIPGASGSGNWNNGDLSQSGQWIRNRLRARTVYDSDPVVDDPVVEDTVNADLPGRLEAEGYFSKSTELQAETTSDAGGGENLGYTTAGSWAEYIVVPQAGSYTAQLRVASASDGGTISLKVNGNSMASWNVGNTGGWQTWTTTTSSAPFQLPSGPVTIRIEWSGSGTSLVNLNWIQFEQGTYVAKNLSTSPTFSTGSFIIRPGFVSFEASTNVKVVSVLTLSGAVFYTSHAPAGKLELPLRKGMNLLRIENKSGKVISMPIIGF